MKADIFLSVRNKAKRLPGKVLLDIKGKTVTEHLIDRLKTCKNASQIVLCTSTNPDDEILVDIAKKNNIDFFKGSEDDKLDRYLSAAEKFGTDLIVVVDGDDVFCDPQFIDKCIIKFIETGADYISVNDLPLGTAPFCIKKEALQQVCKSKKVTNTEVWGWLFTKDSRFKVAHVEVTDKKLLRPDIRLTLDYMEDFILIKKIFDSLYIPGNIITLEMIVDFVTANPKLLDINKKAQVLYEENLKKLLEKIR